MFMLGLSLHQSGFSSSNAFAALVLQGDESLKAFTRAKALAPELEPDGDWLNSLQWVELWARQLGLRGDR